MSGLRVAVVGGGLGGLCLAQGLRKRGQDVTVYEADYDLLSRRQGYRLHLDARAGLALERCLPPALFELFLMTCSQPSRSFTVLGEQLRVLHQRVADSSADPFAAQSLSTSANRQTLREVLTTGLGDRLVFGAKMTAFESGTAGARLLFADGTSADADVLVGADGVHSVVRGQYLPHAEPLDTGARVIYGKTLLTDTVETLLPPAMLDGFTAVVGGNVGLAVGPVRLRTRPDEAAAGVPGAVLSAVDDYLMWAVSADHDRFPLADDELAALGPDGLHRVAASMISTWHPALRELVDLAAVAETFLVRVRTSTPTPAWAASRVTLLGDAIHAMSPAGGSGANTALQDAGLLCSALGAGSGTPTELVAAIGGYEAEMREYGSAAVEASRRAATQMGGRGHGLVSWLNRRRSRGRGLRRRQ